MANIEAAREMSVAQHLRRLIDSLDTERLKWLAEYIGAELDRRRLESTLENIDVRELQE